jgi:hypothetical protein
MRTGEAVLQKLAKGAKGWGVDLTGLRCLACVAGGKGWAV